MEFASVDQFLWLSGFLCNIGLLYVLVVRAKCRCFPVFTSLMIFQLVSSVGLFFVSRYLSSTAYQQTFWATAIIDYVFQVAFIVEVGAQVLRPAGVWVQNSRRSVLRAAGLLVILAVSLSAMVTVPDGSVSELWDVRIELFTSLLTCGLYLCLVSVANRSGLLWRSHLFALGQGVAIWAAMACVGDVAHIAIGWTQEFKTFEHVRMWIYIGTVVYWTYSFWIPELAISPVPIDMNESLRIALQTLDRGKSNASIEEAISR